jgi:predicted nucleic acid-binding protein
MLELYEGAKNQHEIEILNQLFDTISYVDIARKYYHHAGIFSQRAARKGKIFSSIDALLAVLAHDERLSLFSLVCHTRVISGYYPLS